MLLQHSCLNEQPTAAAWKPTQYLARNRQLGTVRVHGTYNYRLFRQRKTLVSAHVKHIPL